jgi:hypothetical protein
MGINLKLQQRILAMTPEERKRFGISNGVMVSKTENHGR